MRTPCARRAVCSAAARAELSADTPLGGVVLTFSVIDTAALAAGNSTLDVIPAEVAGGNVTAVDVLVVPETWAVGAVLAIICGCEVTPPPEPHATSALIRPSAPITKIAAYFGRCIESFPPLRIHENEASRYPSHDCVKNKRKPTVTQCVNDTRRVATQLMQVFTLFFG